MHATVRLPSQAVGRKPGRSIHEILCDTNSPNLSPDVSPKSKSSVASASAAVTDVIRRLSATSNEDVKDNHAHWLVDSSAYNVSITFVVLLNTLELGLEAEYPDQKLIWSGCEHAFTGVFVAEMLIKLSVYHWHYFRDGWNVLDFALAVSAALDVWVLRVVLGSLLDLQSFSILRIMRMARLVRVLRLVKKFQRLILILSAVADSIRTTAWAGMLLGLCVYVCAIFCVEYVGRGTSSIYPGYADFDDIDSQELLAQFNPYLFFGSMPRSMLTLFGIATLSEWREIVWPIVVKQPLVICFFVVFTMFVTFGVMNVIVGMIVEGVMTKSRSFEMETKAQERARSVSILGRIQMCLKSIDTDQDGRISAKEIEDNILEGGLIAELMKEIDLPRGFTAAEFHRVLDTNGTDAFPEDVFVESLYRLIDSSPFKQSCMVQMSMNQLKFMMGISNTRMSRLENICEQLLSTMTRSAAGHVSTAKSNSCDDILGKKLPSPATQASDVSACSPIQSETRQSDLSCGQGSIDHALIKHGDLTEDINCNFMQTVPLPEDNELQASLAKAHDDPILRRPPIDSITRLGALVGPAFQSQFETQVGLFREELDERIKSCVGDALNTCFTLCSSTNSFAHKVTNENRLVVNDQLFSGEELSADKEFSLHDM
eukprot:TRINITY_DN16511_c0_g1_i11.p1 TRINITY_DN16511_c0_g1~~TRINITY_DN16511_c0_g1_i11.p1  ORF type:complete len:656 (-),score=62.25 TRINITY_DN16511_c0_g1_i11:79-2046(-)